MIKDVERQAPPAAAGAEQPEVLRLEGLQKSYGTEKVLDDVSLRVRKGEFVTLLGPSGSGKTTTLMSVAGFVQTDSGEIWLDGRDVSALPPHRRNIGMVFQSYALFPHLSVLKNVTFPLGMRGIKGEEARRKAESILAVVGLAGFEDRSPRQLSGGQQQRVALARAMVFEPRLLLMDEPLGALDKNLRTLLQSEIVRISRELGATTLYVTHDQEEAMTMSDRIAVYSDGRIRQCGSPVEVYNHPNSVFVAEFLGESNILRGERGTEGTFRTASGTLIAVPANRWPNGPAAAVVVRPQMVQVERAGDWPEATSDDGHTRAPGTVREIAYLGADERRVVDTELGVVVSRSSVTADAPRFDVGDAVTVSWATSACAILRDD